MAGKSLGVWLKERREELDLSRPQVAVRAKSVSASHLQKIENEERVPSARVLSALAPIYQVKVEWLLREAGVLPAEHQASDPEPAFSSRTSVSDAIKADPDLDARDKRLMRELYNTLKAK